MFRKTALVVLAALAISCGPPITPTHPNAPPLHPTPMAPEKKADTPTANEGATVGQQLH